MSEATKLLTLADLKKATKKAGGTVEGGIEGRWAMYYLEAPEGKAWACDGSLTSLHVTWLASDPKYRHEAIEDAIERLGYGLCDADDESEWEE